MNNDMFRWIFASVTKHAETNRSGIKLWIDGQDRDTSTSVSYFDLKINDYAHVSRSKNENKYSCSVNINVSVNKNGAGTTLHTFYTNIGIANFILNEPISIYKYGSGTGDDSSLVGCLTLVGSITTENYGILVQGTGLQQATVEASFTIEL